MKNNAHLAALMASRAVLTDGTIECRGRRGSVYMLYEGPAIRMGRRAQGNGLNIRTPFGVAYGIHMSDLTPVSESGVMTLLFKEMQKHSRLKEALAKIAL